MTGSEWTKLAAVLKAAYPRQEIGVETLRVYQGFLADLDYLAAQKAVQRHIATSPFFPTIAEIRAAALEITDPLPSPEEAWEIVAREKRRAEQRFGAWVRPRFEEPLIERAVAACDWQQICESDAPAVIRAQFLEIYRGLRQAERERQAMAGLSGPVDKLALPMTTGGDRRVG